MGCEDREVRNGPFIFYISYESDDDSSIDHYGNFTDDPEIPYWDRALDLLVVEHCVTDSGNVRYTVYEEDDSESTEYDPEAGRHYRGDGWGRYIDSLQQTCSTAKGRELCRHAVKRLEEYAADDWTHKCMKVSTFMGDQNLDIDKYLGGIESDASDWHCEELEKTEIEACLEEAYSGLPSFVQMLRERKVELDRQIAQLNQIIEDRALTAIASAE